MNQKEAQQQDPPIASENVPISEVRLQECLESARKWTELLPYYASGWRKRDDNYALAAAILSAITSLGVWTTLKASPQWPVLLAVSLVSVTAAVVAFIPTRKHYAENAKHAASLASKYGSNKGELIDVLARYNSNSEVVQEAARKAVEKFEKIKAEKDKITLLPTDVEVEKDRGRGSEI